MAMLQDSHDSRLRRRSVLGAAIGGALAAPSIRSAGVVPAMGQASSGGPAECISVLTGSVYLRYPISPTEGEIPLALTGNSDGCELTVFPPPVEGLDMTLDLQVVLWDGTEATFTISTSGEPYTFPVPCPPTGEPTEVISRTPLGILAGVRSDPLTIC